MAYADLGGLGTKQGAPVVYDWAAANAMPQLVPWLAILGLLLLKPNRRASAWWIWVPLGCVAAVANAPQSIVDLLPSAAFQVFLDLIGALGFGLAAVWLMSSYLAWKHRMLAFLGILLPLTVFGVLAFALRLDWQGVGLETLQSGIFLTASVLVISVALSLAGLLCRRRYGWLRLTSWSVAALAVLWLIVIGPFFVITVMASPANVPVWVIFAAVGMATGVTFGSLLPFLVLSFANRFYRERLKALLYLGDTTAPPVITPPMRAEPTAVAT